MRGLRVALKIDAAMTGEVASRASGQHLELLQGTSANLSPPARDMLMGSHG